MNKITVIAILLCVISSCIKKSTHKELPAEKGEWVKLIDTNSVAGYHLINNQIYGLDVDVFETISISQFLYDYIVDYKPINGVDVETFEVCINNEREPYAKDKRYVYHPHGGVIYDAEDWSAWEYGSDLKIPGADPKTFRYIGKGYAVDKYNMYFCGGKIKWNDSIIDALQKSIYQ